MLPNIYPVKIVETFHGTSLQGFHVTHIYSDFQSYEVHLSPLIACGEGVGGGVLVPGLMTICCNFHQMSIVQQIIQGRS